MAKKSTAEPSLPAGADEGTEWQAGNVVYQMADGDWVEKRRLAGAPPVEPEPEPAVEAVPDPEDV